MIKRTSNLSQRLENIANNEAEQEYTRQMLCYYNESASFPDYNKIWLDIYTRLLLEFNED